jgi:hypothetical protein
MRQFPGGIISPVDGRISERGEPHVSAMAVIKRRAKIRVFKRIEGFSLIDNASD